MLPLSGARLDGPGALADPVVAAFLQEQVGPTVDPAAWTWQVQTATSQVAVTLADLGLTVADSLALTAEDLTRLAVGQVGGTGPVPASMPSGRERAERLARLLGARPAVPADLATDGAEPPDRAIRLELVDRLLALIDAARILLGAIRASFDEDVQRSLLREAARWGIAPIPRAGDDPPLAGTDGRSNSRCATPGHAAARRGSDRFGRTPRRHDRRPGFSGTPDAGPGPAERRRDRRPRTDARAAAGSGVAGDRRGGPGATGSRSRRTSWARLRSRPGPNRPGDPWQKALTAAEQDEYTEPTSALVVAYGPAGTLDGVTASDQFAVGLVDSWSEVVPRSPRNTVAAFGFNAPSARPPQSVLLAVTPDVSKPIESETLLKIVLETRDLLRARVARPDDLGALAAGVPTDFLPDAEPTGVRLEP